MKDFEAIVPSVCEPAVEPLRTRDGAALLAAIGSLATPLTSAVAAELIALGFAHADGAVRKKALALVTKHVPDVAEFKAAYKTLANADQHVIEQRVTAFEHPYRLDVAKALLFHRRVAATLPFEQDEATRAALLDVMVERARREDERELRLGEIYWYWRDESGWATFLNHRVVPPALFDELARRRAVHPFDGLSFHGGSLTTLPAELARARPWLRTLSIGSNPFTTLPAALWELTNLEELSLLGTELVDVPADIARLTKLRRLDLGNMKKMKEVPASVCALDHVESLRLGNGSIRKVPDAIVGMRALRELELQSTQIAKLPAGLAQLPHLRKVNVRWSKVPDQTIADLEAAGIEVER
jgi:hypothetical protein